MASLDHLSTVHAHSHGTSHRTYGFSNYVVLAISTWMTFGNGFALAIMREVTSHPKPLVELLKTCAGFTNAGRAA